MFKLDTVLMSADSFARHKQFAVDKRIIVYIELTTPRLTGLTETVTNSFRWTHTATESESVFTLSLI